KTGVVVRINHYFLNRAVIHPARKTEKRPSSRVNIQDHPRMACAMPHNFDVATIILRRIATALTLVVIVGVDRNHIVRIVSQASYIDGLWWEDDSPTPSVTSFLKCATNRRAVVVAIAF